MELSNGMVRFNQAELVKEVAGVVGVPDSTAKSVIDTFVDTMRKALLKGKRISLSGFVVLDTRKRKSYLARNPRTGERVKVPVTKGLVVKASSSFKRALNGKAVVTGAKRGRPPKATKATGAAKRTITKVAAKRGRPRRVN